MNGFKDYVDAHNKAVSTSGAKPSMWGYFSVRFADGIYEFLKSIAANFAVVVLVVLTLIFAYFALFISGVPDDGKKWLMNLVSLCLGVFLGLFKNKKL